MCRQCARGGCTFYFRNRGAATSRALASACSPTPATQTILNWGLGFTPQTPLKGEMDWCRVVGPRGLCRPLDEKQTTWPSRPVKATRCANTGQRRAGQCRALFGKEANSPGPGGPASLEFASRCTPPDPPKKHRPRRRWWVWGSSLLPNGKEVIRGAASLQSSCTGRLYPPSPCCRDARPGASVGASSAHANGQRRSRQFRV